MDNGFGSTHTLARDDAGQPDRLFVAALPDAAAASQIHDCAKVLRRANRFEGRLIEPRHLHISLFFLGLGEDDGCEDRIARMDRAANKLKASAFDVMLDRSMSFSKRAAKRPFVLVGGNGVRQLAKFREALGAEMIRSGLRGWARPGFTPHVTLLYDWRGADELPIMPVSWVVREFVLIRSLHQQNKHVALARWSLRH